MILTRTLSQLDVLLDQLESDLPGMMVEFPDHDGADFWLEFGRRAASIHTLDVTEHKAHVCARLDAMLRSRGLEDSPLPAAEPDHAAASPGQASAPRESPLEPGDGFASQDMS